MLYPLETSTNQRFSDVFRGYRNWTLKWYRLIAYWMLIFSYIVDRYYVKWLGIRNFEYIVSSCIQFFFNALFLAQRSISIFWVCVEVYTTSWLHLVCRCVLYCSALVLGALFKKFSRGIVTVGFLVFSGGIKWENSSERGWDAFRKCKYTTLKTSQVCWSWFTGLWQLKNWYDLF